MLGIAWLLVALGNGGINGKKSASTGDCLSAISRTNIFLSVPCALKTGELTGSFGMKITKRRKKNLKQKEEKFKRRFP